MAGFVLENNVLIKETGSDRQTVVSLELMGTFSEEERRPIIEQLTAAFRAIWREEVETFWIEVQEDDDE